MNRKQKIIVSVTGIFLVLLLLVGLTYGYFLTKIKGNTNKKSITVNAADLNIIYGDGNGTITGDQILPGTTLDEKTFTVTNEGSDITDYVVVIEDVSVTDVSTGDTTTFESNDFVYTLTCTSDGETCNGVDTEVTFPITGGILVGNSIEVGKTHTYSLTVTYKETGIDQSNDMNKTLTAKVNIADPNSYNPYVGDKTTLAYNIVNNATSLNTEKEIGYAELRTTPLTTPAVETTMLYTDNGAGTESTKNYVSTTTFTTANAAKYYITYGDTYSYTTTYTITNKDSSSLQAVLLSTGYETLIGKYIVSTSGSTSSTAVSGSGKSTIYYVTNATETTIEYLTLSGGLASNEKYITYGDSYKFNASTGTYTINNVKTIKYSEGYKSVLVGKYIVNTSGANSSTVATSTNLSSIYLVTGNSTETAMAYKNITKKTTADSYVSAESTLSMTTDDYGTSYYYRGGVKNNYLNFNGMCWRIVRIEGDGSVKITLAAQKVCSEITDNDKVTAFIGTGNYGYTYDYVTNSSGATSSSKKVVADYVNGQTNNTSSMKYKFDEWLMSSGIDISKLKKDKWCLGNTTDAYDSSGKLLISTVNDLMYNGTSFYYDTNVRLYGKGQTANATLRCDGSNYKTYESYIGALTVDEVVYAGGKVGANNYSYYLRDNALSSNYWWTLSLSYYTGSGYYSLAFRINNGGFVNHSGVDESVADFRPVVVLAPSTVITGGNGTISNPYIVA